MDFNRLPDDEKVHISKRYFFIGLALLPLVWMVNVVCFFRHAFCKEPSPAQKLIRKYVTWSLIGSIFWVILFVAWQFVFHIERVKGLVWTDRLTFVFPLGYV